MRNKKKLLIEQLDQKLANFKDAGMILVPQKGWINTIRNTLNMTRDQLGTKLDLTKGGVQKIEERETTGQITINKLKDVGNALNMKLEDQGISENKIENSINDLANEIKREMRKSLWD